LFPQHLIDVLDLILDNLCRRVPNAKFFPQLWVERFKKGFIEVKDCRRRGNTLAVSVLLEGRRLKP
jgi:hypothetical protein